MLKISLSNHSWIKLLALISCLPLVQHAALAQQAESSVSCNESTEPLDGLLISYGEFTSSCAIDTATDRDRFRFFGSAGDRVRITVNGGPFNPRIELQNPTGSTTRDVNCGLILGCSFSIDETLVNTGFHSVVISDKTIQRVGSYTLQMEVLPPTISPATISFDVPQTDTIDPVTDLDFFSFDATQNTAIRISLSGGPFEPQIEIIDPAGNILVNRDCGLILGCSFSVDTCLPATGTYHFAVSGDNLKYTGGYEINVSFMSNTCLVAALLPAGRSVQVGSTATVFATVINTLSFPVTGCEIATQGAISGNLVFQTTDPATNALIGTANQPVDIPANTSQSFVVGITPTSAFQPQDIEFRFVCDNTGVASSVVGVNSLLLSASNTAVPDIVALAATVGNDGVVKLSSSGAFAVATVNVGTGANITATADTGNAIVPVSISICETNPSTAACISPVVDAATGITTRVDANETPTFGIFISSAQNIPFDPAVNRVFVRFRDDQGIVRGATSVAVLTP